jgi:hypothetical protein
MILGRLPEGGKHSENVGRIRTAIFLTEDQGARPAGVSLTRANCASN